MRATGRGCTARPGRLVARAMACWVVSSWDVIEGQVWAKWAVVGMVVVVSVMCETALCQALHMAAWCRVAMSVMWRPPLRRGRA